MNPTTNQIDTEALMMQARRGVMSDRSLARLPKPDNAYVQAYYEDLLSAARRESVQIITEENVEAPTIRIGEYVSKITRRMRRREAALKRTKIDKGQPFGRTLRVKLEDEDGDVVTIFQPSKSPVTRRATPELLGALIKVVG